MASKPSVVANRFARALDAENYLALADLLAKKCQYVTPKGTFIGPESIVNSYREASAWARANIRSVNYESTVRIEHPGKAVVTLLDHLKHEGQSHTYACEQIVLVGVDGKIHQIVHREIPGQREAVDSFLEQFGVKRNASSSPTTDG